LIEMAVTEMAVIEMAVIEISGIDGTKSTVRTTESAGKGGPGA